jgi:CBS-domain-containing membrane protein
VQAVPYRSSNSKKCDISDVNASVVVIDIASEDSLPITMPFELGSFSMAELRFFAPLSVTAALTALLLSLTLLDNGWTFFNGE